jgi:perosamine synthetase
MPNIPVYRPALWGREKDYVNECLETSWISSKGDFVESFERQFGRFIGSENATTVCNGTVALHLALVALGIKPGDEVIVPTLTYVASVNTILQAGAVPVFVDSLATTWQLDPEDVRRKIGPSTRAIMAVHLYGQPCDLDALGEICGEHQLFLIEDCAEAFGTWYKGRHVGTFGDAATFSFFGNKTITTGEGGMVVAKSKNIYEGARHLKNQGVSMLKEYWHDTLAFNYRMTNICAAIGLAQLEQAQRILERKRYIQKQYVEELAGLPLSFQHEAPGAEASYWMVSVLVQLPEQRELLRRHLRESGIETRPLFPTCHEMPHCKVERRFPTAEDLSARGINLPSYPDLTDAEIRKIVDCIRDFYA